MLNLIDDLGIFATRPKATKQGALELEDDLGLFKEDDERKAIADYIRANEGTEAKVYNDTSGNKTIGIGHLLKEGEDPAKIDIEDTFNKDLDEKIKVAKSLFPKYNDYPLEVKQALVDGVFRGEHKKGYKTTNYINEGLWDKVPDEYVNRQDYRASKASEALEKPFTGVYKRMDRNADIFRNYAAQSATRPASTANTDILGQLEQDLNKPLELEDDLGIFGTPADKEPPNLIYKEGENFFTKLAKETGKATLRGGENILGGIAGLGQWAAEAFKASSNMEVEGVDDPRSQWQKDKANEFADKLIDYTKFARNWWKGQQTTGIEAPDPKIFAGTYMENPSIIRTAAIIAEASPSLAAATVISIATGNPVVGGMFLGFTEGQEQYHEAKEAGKDMKTATFIGGLSSVGTGLLESIPLGRFARGGSGKVGKDILAGAFQEGTEEVLQTFWQNSIAKIGYDKTRELTAGMIESFIGGAGSGGIMGGFTSGRAQQIKAMKAEAMLNGVDVETMSGIVGDQIKNNIDKIEDVLKEQIKNKQQPKYKTQDVNLMEIENENLTLPQLKQKLDIAIEGKEDQELIDIIKKDITKRETSTTKYKAAPMYSSLQRTIEKMPQDTMTPDQLMGYIRGKVKQDELFATGLEDYIKDKPKVSKQDVLDYLKENDIEVEEVVKISKIRDMSAEERQEYEADIERAVEAGTFTREHADRLLQEDTGIGDTQTKYSKYQDLGGENYREILLTVEGEKPNKIVDAFSDFKETKPLFKSSHWGEPNVISHARISDVNKDGKKYMAVEEIQSDWAREYRNRPEKPTNLDPQKEAQLRQELLEMQRSIDKVQDRDELEQLQMGMDNIREQLGEPDGGGIPNHPLLKKWQEFTLKKLLQRAVDEGYDGMLWTTGEQQADRYDLSKQIRKIDWGKNHDGTYDVSAVTLAPEKYVTKRKLLKEDIANFVGKDIAEKISSSKKSEGIIEGLDLKIGGEWAKSLYDVQIPSILKKLGGKVTTVDVTDRTPQIGGIQSKALGTLRQELTQPAIEITPELRAKIEGEGLPKFKAVTETKEAQDKSQNVVFAENLIKELLPEVQFEQVENLFTEWGQMALGMYQGGKIKIIRGADADVYTHEIVHGFFDLFLTADEQADLINSAKKVFGVETTLEAEEALADAFNAYMQNKGKVRGKSLTKKIIDFFNKVITQLKKLAGVDQARINDFYDAILEKRRGDQQGKAASEARFKIEDIKKGDIFENAEGDRFTVRAVERDYVVLDVKNEALWDKYDGGTIYPRKSELKNFKRITPKTQKDIVKETVAEKPKSIKEVSQETGILEPNVRRILGVGAKDGTFERVEQGVYRLKIGDQDIAYIHAGDALEVLPKLATQGFKADMVFLDIPYDTAAVRGGNRGVKYNLISPTQFENVIKSIKVIARTKDTPILYMYSQAKSGLRDMQKYNDVLTNQGLKPIAKGEYTKLQKDGITRVRNMRGDIIEPEGIMLLTKSGKFNKETPNLNFKLVRPRGYQTEKPAAMLKALIEATTQEGEVVLDPFAGSGVTGAEAVRTGRKAVLIEKSEEAIEQHIKPKIEEVAKAPQPTGEVKEKPKIITQPKTLRGLIRSMGGLNIEKLSKDYNLKELRQEIPSDLLRTDGRESDDLAGELQTMGYLKVPTDMNAGDYLIEQLKEGKELPEVIERRAEKRAIQEEQEIEKTPQAIFQRAWEKIKTGALDEVTQKDWSVVEQILEAEDPDVLAKMNLKREQIQQYKNDMLKQINKAKELADKPSIIPESQTKSIIQQATGVTKSINKVVANEMSLLKSQIRTEQKGVKIGRAYEKTQAIERIKALKAKYDQAKTQQEKQNLKIKLQAEVRAARQGYQTGKTEIRSAEAIKRKVSALIRSINSLANRRIPIDYKEQVDTILAKYDLHYRTPKTMRKRASMLSFVESLKEQGETIPIPAEYLADLDKITLNDMTVDDLQAIHDIIQQIVHIGANKGRLLAAKDKADFEQRETEIVEQIGQLGRLKDTGTGGRTYFTPSERRKGVVQKITNGIDAFFAAHRKVEFIAKTLDKFQVRGVIQRYIIEPIQEASNKEQREANKIYEQLQRIYKGIDDLNGFIRNEETVAGRKMTREEMVAVYLNSRNEGNLDRLLSGNEFTEAQMQEVIDKLTFKEKKFADEIFDLLESMYSDSAETLLKLTGIRMGKVEGRYFPIAEDYAMSLQAQLREMEKDLFEQIFQRTYINRSHTKERVGGKAPVDLDITKVIINHIDKVLHFNSHALAVRDVQKLIKSPNVKKAIVDTLGENIYNQFPSWLKVVANPHTEFVTQNPYLNSFDKAVGWLKHRVTGAALGIKAAVSLLQAGSITQTVHEIGLKNTLQGIWGFHRHPIATAQFIFDKSVQMQNRNKTFDRDIKDWLKSKAMSRLIQGKKGASDLFYAMIHGVDMMATLPTWLGAYNQMMAQTADQDVSVKYADGVVRRTQPAGSVKDVAAVSRGANFTKIFSMFYSHFSNYHNQMAQHLDYLKFSDDHVLRKTANSALAYWWLLVAPALLAKYIRSGGKERDPKEYLKAILQYGFGGLIFIRDLVSSASTGYDYKGTPVLTPFTNAFYAIKGKQLKTKLKYGFKSVGTVAGLPTEQLWLWADAMMDMADGERVDWRRFIWSKQALGEDKKSGKSDKKTGFDKLYGGDQAKEFEKLFAPKQGAGFDTLFN